MRRGLRLLLALALVAAGATALAVAGPGQARRAHTAAPLPPMQRAHAAAPILIQRAHAAAAVPSRDRRITFLVVGSDAGAPRHGRGGTAAGGRGDALHLVVVDGGKRRGVILDLPRDSWVPIPGHRTSKINAALTAGGPPLLDRTVEQLTGIRVDYFVLTSFDGLADLVNRVGKVQVSVDQNIDDRFSGAHLRKGSRVLDGEQALAYARARKTLPGGDLDRTRHQGLILLGGLGTYQRQAAANPAATLRWLAAMRDSVQTDLPFPELLRLALFARTVPPSAIRNVGVPGVPGVAGAASVVRLTPAAYALFDRVRRGALT